MFHFTGSSAFVAALAFVAMACATASSTSPDITLEQPIARVVPDLAGLSGWLDQEARNTEQGASYFIQMADTQLGMSEYPLWLLLLGATFRDNHFETDAQLFETAIRHANELKPTFVIICGDLVNRVGHAGQIAEFQRIVATLDPSIPLHVVAGNHDVGNEPTEKALRAYRQAFGADWYSFQQGGIHGIVLNSQLIDSPENAPEEAERQLSWVRDELERARDSRVQNIIVFQHQPLFLESAVEDDEYFNIERNARALYLELFERAGVEAVMAGHLHRNALAEAGDLEMITTGPVGKPLGDDPSGFRIVEVRGGSIRHEYFALKAP